MQQPQRIFFMADHLGHANGLIHGGTTYFLNTLPALRDAGYDVTPVFIAPRHPAAEQLEAAGVRPHFLGLGKRDLRCFTAFTKLLDAKPHDVVHLHSFKSHLAGRRAAHKRGIASVVHVHDQIAIKQPMRLLQRRLSSATAALVGITDSVTRHGHEQYGVPIERCHTVLHGLNLAPFVEARERHGHAVRRELSERDEARVIVMSGRLNPVKGHPQLFEAMVKVVVELPPARLWVVGDGKARGDYERQVRELGLTDRVRFLGQRGDMPAVLASADLAVVPSMWEEGFGMVALEASASGLPVVGFKTGGLATIVREGEGGLLVERGDTGALASAILSLLRDDEHRRTLGADARRVTQTFTLSRHVAAMGKVYALAIDFARSLYADRTAGRRL